MNDFLITFWEVGGEPGSMPGPETLEPKKPANEETAENEPLTAEEKVSKTLEGITAAKAGSAQEKQPSNQAVPLPDTEKMSPKALKLSREVDKYQEKQAAEKARPTAEQAQQEFINNATTSRAQIKAAMPTVSKPDAPRKSIPLPKAPTSEVQPPETQTEQADTGLTPGDKQIVDELDQISANNRQVNQTETEDVQTAQDEGLTVATPEPPADFKATSTEPVKPAYAPGISAEKSQELQAQAEEKVTQIKAEIEKMKADNASEAAIADAEKQLAFWEADIAGREKFLGQKPETPTLDQDNKELTDQILAEEKPAARDLDNLPAESNVPAVPKAETEAVTESSELTGTPEQRYAAIGEKLRSILNDKDLGSTITETETGIVLEVTEGQKTLSGTELVSRLSGEELNTLAEAFGEAQKLWLETRETNPDLFETYRTPNLVQRIYNKASSVWNRFKERFSKAKEEVSQESQSTKTESTAQPKDEQLDEVASETSQTIESATDQAEEKIAAALEKKVVTITGIAKEYDQARFKERFDLLSRYILPLKERIREISFANSENDRAIELAKRELKQLDEGILTLESYHESVGLDEQVANLKRQQAEKRAEIKKIQEQMESLEEEDAQTAEELTRLLAKKFKFQERKPYVATVTELPKPASRPEDLKRAA